MYYKNAVNNIPCIYKLTDTRNGKIYIGQTKNLSKRIIKYRSIFKNRYDNSGPAWLRKMMASGEEITMDDVTIESIERVDDSELRNEREKYWIKYYDSANPEIGYNTENGGGVPKYRVQKHAEAPNGEEVIYVYDSEENLYYVYSSCSKFGKRIDMASSNVAERARSCRLARNGRYYIFFENREKRQKALDKYFNMILANTKEDAYLRDNGLDCNANSRIASRLNYSIHYFEVARNVLSRYVPSGTTTKEEVDTVQQYIDMLQSFRKLDNVTIANNKKAAYLEYCRSNNYPVCDDYSHVGKGIIVYDVESDSAIPLLNGLEGADYLEENDIKITANKVMRAARTGCRFGRFIVYFANCDARRERLSIVREDYLKNRRPNFYAYMKGYFTAEKMCSGIIQSHKEF